MGGTCGALGWERGERRHKRKGLGGYMWSARLGASVGRATDGRPTDLEKEGLAIGESVCVCVCLCEGAALLREFLSRAREKG